MQNKSHPEQLVKAWVKLSGMIKNTRITKGLVYNEATVMLLLYDKYKEDGKGVVSVKEIVAETNMLKSLVNRTVNSLEKKGFLERIKADSGDKRMVYVKCIEDKLDTFLKVHNGSIAVAEKIIGIIGEEDAKAFARIVDKIEKSGYSVN